ncbi:hypothetical protein AHF37_09742 [Paragonimus kellicotti]|nr:hypothetical protein AHF37_09742 [Paragonimus kellicotti]
MNPVYALCQSAPKESELGLFRLCPHWVSVNFIDPC